MSSQVRPVETVVTVCDLCGEVIPASTGSTDRGSLIAGYIAHDVTPVTKRAWLRWPDLDRQTELRRKTVDYDFHGRCITDLVEANLHRREVVDDAT